MLHAVLSLQRLGHGSLTASYTSIAEPCKRNRIPLAGQNSIDDPETARSGDIAENPMNLKVHLVQRFLHVKNMLTGHLN